MTVLLWTATQCRFFTVQAECMLHTSHHYLVQLRDVLLPWYGFDFLRENLHKDMICHEKKKISDFPLARGKVAGLKAKEKIPCSTQNLANIRLKEIPVSAVLNNANLRNNELRT